MKKYLIRAGFDPLKTPDPTNYVGKSFVGGNSGNLMFAYGVMNALCVENVELTPNYQWTFTDFEVDEINEKYDAFILPMADAFRSDFIRQLKGYTELLKRIKIPTIVVGVGLRTDYEPDFSKSFEFDEAARDFIRAVRERSAIVGLRGTITADYLKHLGFKEEIDFTPIGCPSLYSYGESVKTQDLRMPISRLAMNTNGYYNVGHINDFLLNTTQKFPDYHLIQQLQNEYHDMFIGNGWWPYFHSGQAKKQDKFIIKGRALSELYKKDRVRFFFDVPSWINFMRSFDMFVGNRFHGSVAAVLSGIPYVMIPFNARTREMVELHRLTSLKPDEIRENTSILDYIDELDVHSFERNLPDNLNHYIGFLEKNGLDHIFKKKRSYAMGESLFEQEIQKALDKPINQHCVIVHDFDSLSFCEKVKRVVACNYKDLRRRLSRY